GSLATVSCFDAASTRITLPRNTYSFFVGCWAGAVQAQERITTPSATRRHAHVNLLKLVSMGMIPACLLFRFEINDLVVLFRRQHADQGHHAADESAPTSGESKRLGLIDFLVHGHHRPFHEGILRKERHLIRILRQFRHVYRSVLHL